MPAGGLRAAIASAMGRLGLTSRSRGAIARNSAAFTIAVVSLSAKMAKADGVAARVEAEVFNHIYRAPEAEARRIKDVYDRAKADIAGFESYADQMATLVGKDEELKRDVFEGLFSIAAADGIFHGGEEAYLRTVAARFGYDAVTYRSIRALFVHDEDDPYVVLGISPGSDPATIKRRHRQLVRDNHPDTVAARGVPPEFVDIADRKLAAINAAYDQIRRERGL